MAFVFLAWVASPFIALPTKSPPLTHSKREKNDPNSVHGQHFDPQNLNYEMRMDCVGREERRAKAEYPKFLFSSFFGQHYLILTQPQGCLLLSTLSSGYEIRPRMNTLQSVQ